jgi:IS5 family transposase
VKATIVTNNRPAPGGQFVAHAKALPDNPHDGHTLRDVIENAQKLDGCASSVLYDAKHVRPVFCGVFGAGRRTQRAAWR